MNEILTAIGRKLIFMGLVYGGYYGFQKAFAGLGFKTEETIKENPDAVAIVLAGFLLALALA